MSVPAHKTCPQCGQPAVLAMARCGRCGYAYAVAPGAAAGPRLSAASRAEVRAAQRQPASRTPVGLLLLAALVTLCLAGTVYAFLALHKARSPLSAASSAAAVPPLTDSAAESDPSSGIFVVHRSGRPIPSVRVMDLDDYPMHLALRSDAGLVYQLDCGPFAEQTLTVPAGHYAVSVWSENPILHPNSGDALFRPYREYSAAFMASVDHSPIHLGD